tara:strand:+ start:45 stop:497 length:453 start_codon:yes stop_codon:yes gene_type:complete
MIAVHLKHGMSRHTIALHQLEKGMVVHLRYKTLSGEGKQYVGTVLNPKWPVSKNPKLHMLSMNEIKLQDYRNFAKGFGIRYIPAFQKVKGVDLPKIDMAISSRRIYEGKVKPIIAEKLNNSYRTLLLKNISGLQLLDYDFGPELNKLLGI